MKRYSPLFVYGNDADVSQNICACLGNQNSKLNSVGDFKGKKNWLGAPNWPLCEKLIRLTSAPNGHILLTHNSVVNPTVSTRNTRICNVYVGPNCNGESCEVRSLWVWPVSLSESKGKIWNFSLSFFYTFLLFWNYITTLFLCGGEK